MRTLRQTGRLIARILFAVLVAATLAGPAFAQPDGGGFGPPPGGGPSPDGFDSGGAQRGPNVDREVKQLTRLLALTADQQTQVKTILTERNQKTGELMRTSRQEQQKDSAQQAAREDSQPGPEQFAQMRAQVKAIRDEANTKIGAVLTAEQAAKYAQWLKRRQQPSDDGMPPPPDGGPGGPPPDGGGSVGPGGGGPPAE